MVFLSMGKWLKKRNNSIWTTIFFHKVDTYYFLIVNGFYYYYSCKPNFNRYSLAPIYISVGSNYVAGETGNTLFSWDAGSADTGNDEAAGGSNYSNYDAGTPGTAGNAPARFNLLFK